MKNAAFLAVSLACVLAATARADGLDRAPEGAHCASRDRIIAGLADGYGETRRSIGLGADDSVMEVFASEETGTWSITMTLSDGTTCLMASGRAYEPVWPDADAALRIGF